MKSHFEIPKLKEKLSSAFDDEIINFVAFKRSLGFNLTTEFYDLAKFDRFAAAKKLNLEKGITKNIYDDFSIKLANETQGAYYERMVMLSQFSEFLATSGYPSYTFKPPTYKRNVKLRPHIYTNREIIQLFFELDKTSTGKSRSAYKEVMPYLFRFAFCTGVRIGEIVKIKNSDVDLTLRQVKITDSKNLHQRIIPIHLSLAAKLKEYIDQVKPASKSRDADSFFLTNKGTPVTDEMLRHHFKRAVTNAGITTSELTLPRIHDLRHTFAVNVITSWIKAGKDVNALLPRLSHYMGHKTLVSTIYYLQFTPELNTIAAKSALTAISDVVLNAKKIQHAK
jgi:integrase/recombinase XerD